MRPRRRHEALLLGDVQLLLPGPEPGSDAAHRRGPLDRLEPDDVSVEAMCLLDAARRCQNLRVIERDVQRLPRSACSRSIENESAEARLKPGTGFRFCSNRLEIAS